jgi:hypothetical protein
MSAPPPRVGSATTSPAEQLVGRLAEREAVDRLLDTARGGYGGVLVVHGDPGVGKTALLEYAVQSARSFSVARAIGVEGEMEFPYTALQQLASHSLELRERLPDHQREAIAVAFGLSPGDPPNAYLVGLAILGLVTEASEERPVLCVVDGDCAARADASASGPRPGAPPLRRVAAARAPTVGRKGRAPAGA